MLLRQATRKTFVLTRATDRVQRARQLLLRLDFTHVIVERTDYRGYHLFTRREIEDKLAGRADEIALFEALGLLEAETTEALDAYTRAAVAPDQCVVLEDGWLIGFFDRNAPLATRGVKEPCSLVADFPEKVTIEEAALLQVRLSVEPDAGDVLPLGLPRGSRVDVVVQAKRGFILEGSGKASLFIPSRGKASPVLQFKVRATAAGVGRISILAIHEGQSLGTIVLRPVVEEAPVSSAAQPLSLREPLGVVSVHAPDLSLLILENKVANETSLDLLVTATNPKFGLNLTRFGPVPLRSDPLRYFRDFFKDIEDLTPDSVGQRKLSAKGSHLFRSLFPEDLQKKLWSLRNQIQSVQVQSEEPWIPWELCKLCGFENRRVVEGRFFCEQFAVTRWLPGVPFKLDLKLGDMAVVVPEDSELPHAQEERKSIAVASAGKWEVRQVPATYIEVCAALASGKFDGWHFSGHGNWGDDDPNRAVIVLKDGQTLTPEDISGATSNLGLAQPLIFLNACRVGHGGLSLTGAGGWATQFLRAGAGAFISANWAVYDAPACEFAKSFYEELAGGQPIGEAVRKARAKIKRESDPTWLAYTVFAHPFATVQLK